MVLGECREEVITSTLLYVWILSITRQSWAPLEAKIDGNRRNAVNVMLIMESNHAPI